MKHVSQQPVRRRGKSRRKPDRRPFFLGAGLIVLLLILWAVLPGGGETPREPATQPPRETAPPLSTEPGPDCPQVLRELLERNPETCFFVAGYPGGWDLDADVSGDYTPGEIPHFLQWDTRWGYYPYGGNQVKDLLGLSGCGPTALSMVAVGVTGNTRWNPAAVADYAVAAGYATENDGTEWTLMFEGCEHLGLTATEVPLWQDSMIEALKSGPIICAMGPGDFTDGGHFIVITGYEEGAFRVLDPNSRANSALAWTYRQLETQVRAMWSYTAA